MRRSEAEGWYAADITKLNGAVNGSPDTKRVVRGGGWRGKTTNSRSAHRANSSPSDRVYNFGFRVVCTAGLQ